MIDVRTLTDKQLQELRFAIMDEEDRRTARKLKAENFPPLNATEAALVDSGHKIKAMIYYRNRVKCGVREAKAIVNSYED